MKRPDNSKMSINECSFLEMFKLLFIDLMGVGRKRN